MIYLEILGLVLATCGALYGIWTRTPRNNTVATISTVVTALGLAAAAGLAIWKSSEAAHNAALAEQKRQGELQAVLGSADLSDIEIVWSFENVPQDVLNIFTIGDMIVDSNFLANDERSRAPAEIRDLAAHAWHLESTVFPLLRVIDVGRFEPKSLYSGELIEEAIHRWKSDKNAWIENIGTNLHYIGPPFEIIFPLNPKSNAAVSLGKVADDKVAAAPQFAWQEDDPALFEQTNFEFHVTTDISGNAFRLTWSYPQSSLNRAVERSRGTKLQAGFPAEFSFVIIRKQLDRKEYLSAVQEHLRQSELPSKQLESRWDLNSTLEIYVNGIRNPHYTYAVTKGATDSRNSDQGAYDPPKFEYDYTIFSCSLRSI